MRKNTPIFEDVVILSDEELLVRSLRDPAYFAVLVDRYQGPFLRKVLGVLHSKEDAEDVVQEAFTRIYLHAGKFTPQEGAGFRSWAYRVLMNTAFTHYQKIKKTRANVETIDEDLFEFLPGVRIDLREELGLRDLVLSVFSRMPAEFARALRLHFLEEYSQKEIAEMEETTVPAIKTRVYRAKAEFRRILNSVS